MGLFTKMWAEVREPTWMVKHPGTSKGRYLLPPLGLMGQKEEVITGHLREG